MDHFGGNQRFVYICQNMCLLHGNFLSFRDFSDRDNSAFHDRLEGMRQHLQLNNFKDPNLKLNLFDYWYRKWCWIKNKRYVSIAYCLEALFLHNGFFVLYLFLKILFRYIHLRRRWFSSGVGLLGIGNYVLIMVSWPRHHLLNIRTLILSFQCLIFKQLSSDQLFLGKSLYWGHGAL